MTNKDKSDPHHNHVHGPNCGHTAVRHGDHVDYLHDGHLHHQDGEHVEEHVIEVSATNPGGCSPVGSDELGHDPDHVHGPGCGHEAVPHGDHICYLVNGRLHHPHDGHCDDHGPIEVVWTFSWNETVTIEAGIDHGLQSALLPADLHNSLGLSASP